MRPHRGARCASSWKTTPSFSSSASTGMYTWVGGRGLQGYLAHRKTPTPLGPPWDPRHRPTVGSWAEEVSYERGTPAGARGQGSGFRNMLKTVASPKKRSFWSLAARLLPLNVLLLEHCTEAEWCLASKEISGKSRDSVRCGYRGGLVSEAHRLLYHSAFKAQGPSRICNESKEEEEWGLTSGWVGMCTPPGRRPAPSISSTPGIVGRRKYVTQLDGQTLVAGS